MKIAHGSTRRGRALTTLGALSLLAALLVTGGPSGAAPTSLVAPQASAAQVAEAPNADALTAPSNLPDVPALPGPLSPAFSLGSSLGILTTRSSGTQSGVSGSGTEGQPLTISGTKLPAHASVAIEWSTSNETWVTDVEPATVNYLGTAVKSFNVTLGTATTDAAGSFSYSTTVPVDFGGQHTIYAVVRGQEVAQGGFTTMRTFTITPTRGPIGTMIHVTYTGLGATAYTLGSALDWDNHFVGEFQAAWTRGTASFDIRAAGPVGRHVLETGAAVGTLYMNSDQSPIPYANLLKASFTTTPGGRLPATQVDWPASVTPTVSQFATAASAGVDPSSTATASLSTTSGPVGSRVTVTSTGLSGSGPDQLVWSSVVGSRVNCPNGATTCWAYASTPLGSAPVTDGQLRATVTVPVTTSGEPGAGLGGWHVIQVVSGSAIVAQTPYYVKESVVVYRGAGGRVLSDGVAAAAPVPTDVTRPSLTQVAGVGRPTYTFTEGEEFTIALNGVGWTEIDNTLAVDYDNSLVGYGCGFNSNGYTAIHLYATGGPGVHLIDLYPELYTLNPDYATTAYGMLPVLSYARDFPGLALGYQVPAFRFAIRIVK
ncbi:MAG TPA: hypothetical protein PLS29_03920 [Acidimicrobiales bacterium]|nr:hypothetical protein [Acidimicrobiales bacterium]